ncbi:MAG: AAA family ATPase [Succinivibrionaceae bacterium]
MTGKVSAKKPLSVDKSRFIEVVEKSANPHILILRPHGFGKSYLINLLCSYYDRTRCDEFEQNYKTSYIANHPTTGKNKYFLLKFSFSSLSGKTVEEFQKNFCKIVIDSLKDFVAANKGFDFQIEEEFSNDPAFVFTSLCLSFSHQYPGEKIYLVIEDYDNYAYDVLFDNRTELANLDFVTDFYEAVKSVLNVAVGRTFITGVFPIALGSLFNGGLNSINNFTTYRAYQDIVGFTESELEEQLDIYLRSGKIKKEKDVILQDLKNVAGGYIFTPYSDGPLYNPRECTNLIHKLIDTNTNIASADSRYQQRLNTLLDLSEGIDLVKLLSKITAMEPIRLTAVASFLRLTVIKEYSEDELLSLLFYLGYLAIVPDSIKKMGTVALTCPNQHIRSYFEKYCKDKKIDLDPEQ